MSLIDDLAGFLTRTRFDDLPQEVMHESKRLLLDSIGCALGGLITEKGKIAVELAKKQKAREATILGVRGKVSTFGAAFANGELMNAMDYDALTAPPGHVSPYVIPPTLALAEGAGAPGQTVILSIALGHEISARLGCALGYYRDIVQGKTVFPPIMGMSCNAFGASAAAGKVLALDQE